MASSVLVNTAEEDEIAVEPVDVVPDDADVVTIDTVQSDLDKLVEELAPARARASPKPAPKKRPVFREEPVQEEPKPSQRKKPAPAPAPPRPSGPPTAKKMLDGQSAFQEALRDTIPASPVQPTEEAAAEEDDAPPPPADNGEVPEGMSSSSSEDEGGDEDDEGTEPGETGSVESGEDDEGPDEEDEEVPPQPQKRRRPQAEEDDEDEDKKKMRLLEESASLMADGFLPVQKPTFSMSVETLEKIVNHQEEQAAEQFGVGLIGFGWVEVIRLIQFANQRFDPAAKIFGPGKGLKLDGAAEAVANDIRRYRGPFRYLWKKM